MSTKLLSPSEGVSDVTSDHQKGANSEIQKSGFSEVSKKEFANVSKVGYPEIHDNTLISAHSHTDRHENSDELSSHQETAYQDYIDQLIRDKNQLRMSHGGPQFKHLARLIDMEITRVLASVSNSLNSSHSLEGAMGQKIILTEKIYVPVDKYPRYNFVGRILGPRGMTAKQLEEETGCKIMVRGRGAMRQEPLHVLVQCEDYESRCHKKLKDACEKINTLLHPPPEGKDELKRKQLIELSIINGTYRPTSATKLALQTPRAMTGFQQNEQFMNCTYQDSRAVLSSIIDQGNMKSLSKNRADEDVENYSKLLSIMANPLSMSPFLNPAMQANDFFKQLFNMSLTDPSVLASLFSSMSLTGNDPFSMNMQQNPFANQCAPIPQANLQQYLQAAAMLNSMPFSHDGSGDAPKGKR